MLYYDLRNLELQINHRSLPTIFKSNIGYDFFGFITINIPNDINM